MIGAGAGATSGNQGRCRIGLKTGRRWGGVLNSGPVDWLAQGGLEQAAQNDAGDLMELIKEKLTQEQRSPDQISGRLAKDGVAFLIHERIYQHVWKDKKDRAARHLHLRHSGKIQQAPSTFASVLIPHLTSFTKETSMKTLVITLAVALVATSAVARTNVRTISGLEEAGF
jgi:hypothetical protein